MTRSQQIGAFVLLLLTVIVLAVLYTHPAPERMTEAYRRDSIRNYWDSVHASRDSIHQYWDSVYTHRDSVRQFWRAYYDSVFARRDSLKHYWDSVHLHCDSLRRDSLPFDSLRFPVRVVKRDTMVELNSADSTDLMKIYGIGRFTALQILRYRQQLGGYYSPRQILEIPALHSERQQQLLDSALHHMTAAADSIHRIPVNRASFQRLIRHPYLSGDQAAALYDLRRKRIKLKSEADLSPLRSSGILSDSDIDRLRYYLSWE